MGEDDSDDNDAPVLRRFKDDEEFEGKPLARMLKATPKYCKDDGDGKDGKGKKAKDDCDGKDGKQVKKDDEDGKDGKGKEEEDCDEEEVCVARPSRQPQTCRGQGGNPVIRVEYIVTVPPVEGATSRQLVMVLRNDERFEAKFKLGLEASSLNGKFTLTKVESPTETKAGVPDELSG